MNQTLADTETHSSLATMKADMTAALAQKQLEDEQQTNAAHSAEQAVTAAQPTDADDNIVLDEVQTSRVIEMAWEDRTPFAAIEHSYGLDETAVIKLMRQELKPSSFRLWRERVTGRNTKHDAKRDFKVGRAYCKTQYKPR